MSDEKLVEREVFVHILEDCMFLLRQYGFSPRSELKSDPQFGKIFEEVCFGLFGEVAPETKVAPVPIYPTGLTQERLDKMTLQCALVFARRGISGVEDDDGLNHIRSAIADVIEAMGYESCEELCSADESRWGCYELWEEVARVSGLDDKEIAAIRRESKKMYPNEYEERH